MAFSSVGRLVVALAAMLFAAGPSSAQPAARVPAELFESLRRNGPIRVIVRVAPPARRFPSAAQDRVLAELAGSRHRVIHRYANAPMLALEVGEEALRALDRSTYVHSVAADAGMRSLSPGTRP